MIGRTPEQAVGLLQDPQWFHGIDKAYRGRAADPQDELTGAFVAWITRTRFHPAIVEARRAIWRTTAAEPIADAGPAEPERATYLVREAARALRMDLLEGWGERLGSMGREWTSWSRTPCMWSVAGPT